MWTTWPTAPRVERIGEHGLFTDAGRPLILEDVQKEVSGHKGFAWTHVLSLRREDNRIVSKTAFT